MSLIPVEEALARILDGVVALGFERVALPAALDRVLAEDLKAERTQPPFAASAMDGYAVRGSDVAKAPATLVIIGEVPAGALFSATIKPGEAVRIFTGAPVPDGADTIVIQENTERSGDTVSVLDLHIRGPVADRLVDHQLDRLHQTHAAHIAEVLRIARL